MRIALKQAIGPRQLGGAAFFTGCSAQLCSCRCNAAITFSQDFEQIKESYLRKNHSFDKVLCNGMSLERFVEKYSYQVLTASLH